ncbi:MAG: S24 family peptidase [Candidatus Thiosymbion ectosymbiont of Robbea hypermnestra]|nr:S24 family peptidase [Candidatus Thiosymbion ectosymbiont of Robbea hypermnestra]
MSDPTLENETGCAWREPFALQVLGDSMEPEFPDRCIVIIEQAERCRHGMYVFAEVEGVRWFRQYRVDEQGGEWLIALNPLYPEIDLTGLEWKPLGIIIQRNIRRRIKHYNYQAGSLTPEVGTLDPTGSG